MSGLSLTFLVFVITFAGAVLLVKGVAIGRATQARRKRVNAIRAHIEGSGGAENSGVIDARVVRDDHGNAKKFERILARILPRRKVLANRLREAGSSLSVGRYASITSVTILVVSSFLRLGFGVDLVFASLIGLACGMMGPHLVVGYMISRRRVKFTKLFPEAIDLMVRGLKSGLPITETMVNAGEEMADPVGPIFREVTDAIRLGKTMDEALWSAADRMKTQEFKFFVISLSVQRETGGNLSETLANLSDILRKRMQMGMKVKAMSSEAQSSAYIIGSLPFIMFGILALMNPDYAFTLFRDPRGLMMVGISAVMMLTGAGVMYKMVRFEI